LDGRGKFLAGNRIFQPEQKAWLCLPEMTRSIVGPRGDAMQMREYDACAGDAVTRMQFADMRTYLPGDILAKVDRTSMLCSLETRCPLLDHELIELVNGIPSALKINGTDQKYILKQAARRLLPVEVLTRRKKGFSVPLSRWLRGELRETVAEILFAKCTQQRGLFDPGAVRQIFNEHKRGRRDHARRLWSLVMLELWQRNFVDG
jgi:asparagine synthase (glutamine-hydrolysing)